MLVQFYKNVKTMVKHGLTIVYHVKAWFYSYIVWFSMVKHGLTIVYHVKAWFYSYGLAWLSMV